MGLLSSLASPLPIVGALLLFIASCVRTYFRLSHIPGPRIAGWTRLWIRRLAVNGNAAHEFGALCKQYGHLVRIGPNHLLTDDPELIRQMTATHSTWLRGEWWNTARFKPRSDNILTTRDLRKHDELRKQMASAYSGKENEMMEQTVDESVQKLVEVLGERYVASNTSALDEDGNARYADLARMMHWFTIDVITALAYGKPLGDLEAEGDKFGYIDMSENSISLMMSMGLFPRIWAFMEDIRVVDIMLYFSNGIDSLVKAMRPLLKKRFAQGRLQQPKDMLGAFIRNDMSYDQIESETTVQLVAGSDTTASALRATVLQLMTNPPVYRRLTAEIDHAERSGALSSPATFSETNNLPYLQACIKEGLRMWPPACTWNPRVVPPSGFSYNDEFHLPGGTLVGWAPIAMQRNPAIYGPNPDMFVPERWIDKSPAQTDLMNRTVDLVFHSGRFKCLGRNVALMELNKVYVELLRRFDVSLVYPSKPWSCSSMGLWHQKELWTQVSEREKGDVKIFTGTSAPSLQIE